MLQTLAIFAILAYLLCTRDRLPARWAGWLAFAALGLHAATIVMQSNLGHGLRINLALALSLMAWQAAALMWLALGRAPLQPLKRPICTLAAVAVLVSVLFGGAGAEVRVSDWRIRLHVALSLLSIGVLTLGAVQAVLLAAQDRYLHSHGHRLGDSRLPPLQTMESLLFSFVGAGFALLSLTLATGVVFVEDMFAQHLAHKTVLSSLAWLVLGVLLYGRWQHGWRGRTAVRWTLWGYGLLLLAYFGSKFVLETLLGRQWS